MGDPASTYETGIVSALNDAAARRSVRIGGRAAEAAARLVVSSRDWPGDRA